MNIKDLQLKSIEYRKTILEIIYNSGAGHTAGSLSCIDILNVLYNNILEIQILVSIIIFLFWLVLPLTVSDFTFQAILIPFVIFSTAALGLNILTGYAGQISLGTGAFMGVGAYSCF